MRVLIAGIAPDGSGTLACRRLVESAIQRGEPVSIVVAGATADLIAELETLGAKARSVQLDLQHPPALSDAVREAIEFCGGLDALLCAVDSAVTAAPMLEVGVAEWDRAFAVETGSVLLLCRGAHDALAESGGAVAIVAGEAGSRPDPHRGLASVTKASVLMTARMLAQEWAGDGVRVNCVSPGSDRDSEEVAAMIAFLLGPDSSYISGEDFVLDGQR